jgi:hypothetical protein
MKPPSPEPLSEKSLKGVGEGVGAADAAGDAAGAGEAGAVMAGAGEGAGVDCALAAETPKTPRATANPAAAKKLDFGNAPPSEERRTPHE